MPARPASSFRSFRSGLARPVSAIKGQVDGIGTRPRLRASDEGGAILTDQSYDPIATVPAARPGRGRLAERRTETRPRRRRASGRAWRPAVRPARLVDDEVVTQLARYVPLAPLHQPNNLAPIRRSVSAFRICRRSPASTRRFIAATSAVADHYAIPERLYSEGVRRYGFHGLSYEYIAKRLPEIAPSVGGPGDRRPSRQRRLDVRAATAASVESTMGFTALDGPADGHTAGPDRSRRRALPDDRQGHERRRSRSFSIPNAG